MDYRWLLRSAVLAPFGVLALSAISPGCGSDVEAESFECTGDQCEFECSDGDVACDATCTKGADCDLTCAGPDCELDCQSKSLCEADCTVAGGCDTNCEGQSTCNVDCSEAGGCDLDCAGGSTCDIKCEGDCGGGCTGTSQCGLTCKEGCDMGCTGDAICGLTCETNCFVCCNGSADCTLTCSGAETTECMVDDNTRILVCGRECPDAALCKYGDATEGEPTPQPE